MKDTFHIRKFYPNYFSFFCQGAMVLVLGSILPYLIQEASLSYTVAGTLLSVFAIGNFLASFVYPALSGVIGRKSSVMIAAVLVPLILISITLVPPVWMLIALFALLGICRGFYSIINNAYINENSDGSAFSLNILHMTFSIGAFASPLFTSVFFRAGFTWRAIIYAIAAGSAISAVLMTRLHLPSPIQSKKDEVSASSTDANQDTPSANQDTAAARGQSKFYKMPVFWISGLILFFYLGLENCVNGWFVTYFRSTGIMSASYANSLVSFTWLAVLAGRLFTALISSRVKKQKIIMNDCLATAAFFILLVSTRNLAVITVSIIALGFFFAGIYATTIANAHSAISGSDLGTSMLLAIAGLGGIAAPQVVGSVADKIGLTGAIGILTVNVVAMIVFSVANRVVGRRGQED